MRKISNKVPNASPNRIIVTFTQPGSPPYQGGVSAAPADGVVLYPLLTIHLAIPYYRACQLLHITDRILFRVAVDNHATKFVDLSDPTAVLFLFKFDW